MRDFLDLLGASGEAYRFKRWPEDQPHSPIAGNYAFVREEAGTVSVIGLGQTSDLSGARSTWSKALKLGATSVYTRLNVASASRAKEHVDLVERHRPPIEES